MSDKFRRIGAWIGIVLLLGIYLVTLISAIMQKEGTGGLFLASLFCTFVVPVWVFVLQAIYNRTHKDAVGKAELKKMAEQAAKEEEAESKIAEGETAEDEAVENEEVPAEESKAE